MTKKQVTFIWFITVMVSKGVYEYFLSKSCLNLSCELRPRNILKKVLALHHKNYWHIWGKNSFTLEMSKFSLALQPEALVNTSGRVLFSSPGTCFLPSIRLFRKMLQIREFVNWPFCGSCIIQDFVPIN